MEHLSTCLKTPKESGRRTKILLGLLFCGLLLVSIGCEEDGSTEFPVNYPLIGEYMMAEWGPKGLLAVDRVIMSDDPNDSSHDPATWGLYTLREDGTDPRPLKMGRTIDLAWSPDGEWIAFVQSGRVRLVRPDGQDLQVLDTGTLSPQGVSWSPDGQWVLFSVIYGLGSDRGLWVIRPDGTGLRQLRKPPKEEMCIGCESSFNWHASLPHWSPDGLRITYIPNVTSWIAVYDTTTARVDFVLKMSVTLYRPRFSPDGKRIVFQTGAFQNSTMLRIGLVDMDGGNHQWLPIAGENPTWSPDGRSILYRRYAIGAFEVIGRMAKNPGRGWGDLWVFDIHSNNHRQLTFANGSWGDP